MEDAGEALAGDGEVLLLGGGNPARIPEVQQTFREAMGNLLDDAPRFDRIVGDYDGPQGLSLIHISSPRDGLLSRMPSSA